MILSIEVIAIFGIALLIAVGIFLYLHSAATALLKSVEQRVKSQAAKRQLAILEAQTQLEASKRNALEAQIRLEELRLQRRVTVLDEVFYVDRPKKVFGSLEGLLSDSRRAFVNSYRELDRFHRNIEKDVVLRREIGKFDKQRSNTAKKAIGRYVKLHCRLPIPMHIHPEPYRENALLDPFERFVWDPLDRIKLLRSLSKTDDVLITLYRIAKYLQSGARLTAQMSPEQKLKFSDYCISIVLLVQDSLVYQLVNFQAQIMIEHINKDMEVVAVEEGIYLFNEHSDAYNRLLERDVESDGPSVELHRQRREMMKNLERSAEQLLAIAQESGAQVRDFHLDVSNRLYELLRMRQDVEKTLLVSREPSKRFLRLLEIGRGIEEELLPMLAGAFGYNLIESEKSSS